MHGAFRIGRIGIALGTALVASGGATAAAPAPAGPATAGPVARPARILGIRSCATREMHISLQPLGGGAHVGWLVRFKHHGPAECALSGYPRVQLTAVGGRRISVRHTKRGHLGGLSYGSPPLIAFEPGHVAAALIEGLAHPASGHGHCPTYRALRVTPPNVTGSVTLNASLTLCAPQVHPIIAGSTGRTPPPPVN